MKRPTSVVAIASIVTYQGLSGLATLVEALVGQLSKPLLRESYRIEHSAISVDRAMAYSAFVLSFTLVLVAFLWKGHNWARLTLLGVIGISALATFVRRGITPVGVFNGFLFLAFLYLLTRPHVVSYFTTNASYASASNGAT